MSWPRWNRPAYEIAGRAGCHRAAASGSKAATGPYHYARLLQGDAAARVVAECKALGYTLDGSSALVTDPASRVIFDGSIEVAGKDYTQVDEDGNDVAIDGLDRRVSNASVLRFTLEYPFERPYKGEVAADGGATLRQIIDAIRRGYRTMYGGDYGEAVHMVEDLVIETIELDDKTGTLEIAIGS